MHEKFFPHEYVESVFAIDYRKLYELGYRGIVFDIDNTLVPFGADATPEVVELFDEIRGIGFRTLLLSNESAERIRRFKGDMEMPFISSAGKPDISGFESALTVLALTKKQVVCIGDCMQTDILGANQAGLESILVKPIAPDDPDLPEKKREKEQRLLAKYLKNKKYQKRLGNIIRE
ncbi:MAG: YqeG family HAD IIIA-type phosphatase [Coriobacteriales bacterium]|jgi:HAD superfamily phosphatase (TIGR01668 family)